MMRPALLFRRWTAADMPSIMQLQAACYPPHLHEGEETMRLRWLSFPEGHEVVDTSDGGSDGGPPRIVAYVQSFPWDLKRLGPPHLDAVVVDGLAAAAAAAPSDTCYYVHDIACVERKRGIGGALMARTLEHAAARGHVGAACTAVGGMEAVWAKNGFAVVRPLDDLGCYDVDGKPAMLMEMRLPRVTAVD